MHGKLQVAEDQKLRGHWHSFQDGEDRTQGLHGKRIHSIHSEQRIFDSSITIILRRYSLLILLQEQQNMGVSTCWPLEGQDNWLLQQHKLAWTTHSLSQQNLRKLPSSIPQNCSQNSSVRFRLHDGWYPGRCQIPNQLLNIIIMIYI